MKLELGPFEEISRWKGDALSFMQADLLCDGEKVGSVHQSGHKPKWSFEINKFRHKYMWDPKVVKSSPFDLDGLSRLLFDGAAWETAAEARDVAEAQLTLFLEQFNAS